MRKVLLVDDESLIRKGVIALIERSGLPFGGFVECSNGADALDILRREHFDVVIVDIRMPRMDGITFIKEAKQLEHTPVIIILSGFDDFQYAKEAIKYGAREYLLKPVRRSELMETLERIDRELVEKEEKSVQLDSLFDQISSDELNFILLNPNLTERETYNIMDKLKIGIFHDEYVISVIDGSGMDEACSGADLMKLVRDHLAAIK